MCVDVEVLVLTRENLMKFFHMKLRSEVRSLSEVSVICCTLRCLVLRARVAQDGFVEHLVGQCSNGWCTVAGVSFCAVCIGKLL